MKRIIACLLTAIFVFSCVGVVAADYDGHWTAGTIKELINSGIISGYDNGDVMPDGQLTRAEFAALINRVGGFTNDDALNFVDILEEEWFAKDLRIARATGYMQGDEYDRANPNAVISRVEALVMVSRAFFPTSDVRYEFSDLKEIPEWARQHIMTLADYGVIKGFEDDSFRPYEPITRGQFFTVVSDVIRTVINAPMVDAARDPNTSEDGPMIDAVRDNEPNYDLMPTKSSSGGGGSSSSSSSSISNSEQPENKNDRWDFWEFFNDFDWFDNYGDYGSSSGSDNWDWWDLWSGGGSGSNSNEYGYDNHDEYGYDKNDEYGYKSY